MPYLWCGDGRLRENWPLTGARRMPQVQTRAIRVFCCFDLFLGSFLLLRMKLCRAHTFTHEGGGEQRLGAINVRLMLTIPFVEQTR